MGFLPHHLVPRQRPRGPSPTCVAWLAVTVAGLIGSGCYYDLPPVQPDEDALVESDGPSLQCGNSLIDPGEGCDDGNTTAGDGCSDACQLEPGWDCEGEPTVCTSDCGDGLTVGEEGCDDGALLPGDGCTADCRVEPYYACSGDPSVCHCAVYVNVSAVPNVRDGAAWPSAYATVQEGVDHTAALGDCEVWVAQGTYYQRISDATDSLRLADGVALYGGFEGTERARQQRDWSAHESILDGRQEGSPSLRAEHVVSASNVMGGILDGFTVTEGAAPVASGGGIDVSQGSGVTICNCLVVGNQAQVGGGLSLVDSQVTVVSSEIRGNNSSVDGGGAVIEGGDVTLSFVIFDNNVTAGDGGGMINRVGGVLQVSDCAFENNSASEVGGGICFSVVTGRTVERTTFVNNTSQIAGGGLWTDQDVEIRDSQFISNTAPVGAGVRGWDPTSSATVYSTLFVQNNATSTGGGALAVAQGAVQLVNCTLYQNITSGSGSAVYNSASAVSLVNCIVRGNGLFHDAGAGTTTAQWCDVEGGYAGTGNIDADPLFVDPATLDFHLQPGSPCIDAGDGSAAPAADAEGASRTDDPNTVDTGNGTPPWTDLGIFEYQPQ